MPARHTIDLSAGVNVITIVVTAEDYETMETYTVRVVRGDVSDDATLSSLTLSGIMLIPAFNPGTTAYTAEVEGLETTTVEAMATHTGAIVEGAGEKTLLVGDNVISVTVTSGDGTSQTYTVTVTVVEMMIPGGTLLDRYDADNSGDIDLTEVNNAIDDYFDDQISLSDVNTVIDLYFG